MFMKDILCMCVCHLLMHSKNNIIGKVDFYSHFSLPLTHTYTINKYSYVFMHLDVYKYNVCVREIVRSTYI